MHEPPGLQPYEYGYKGGPPLTPQHTWRPVVGEGVNYGINGDSYPGTVRRVSASGKTVWVSCDGCRYINGGPYFMEGSARALFTPLHENEPEMWLRFSLRKDGWFTRSGSKWCVLRRGRNCKRNPYVSEV